MVENNDLDVGAAEHSAGLASYPDVLEFIRQGGITLRGYQEQVARSVIDSVLNGRGLAFTVMFPRQSGKNELQAQIETYLLALLRDTDAEIVKVSPTWRPQSINAMRRLERVLSRHPLTKKDWVKESGFVYRVGRARITFLSGAPEANIVGATASTLLEVDEAQNVGISKFDRDIAPMASSTNATRVFWGTAWTSHTLLARELRACQEAEREAGRRLTFVLTAEDVAREAPAYGKFVDGQVARLGRDNVMIKTQYFSEEVDGQVGMFPDERIALMEGDHAPLEKPAPGRIYALLLDVAGEDEQAREQGAFQQEAYQPHIPGIEDLLTSILANPGRDASALTIVEVDLKTRADPLICAPTYRVMLRRLWVGNKHTELHRQVQDIARQWKVQRLVVDATGVGAGVASFLDESFPGRVERFLFTSASKSRLGWDFLALVNNGRWKEPRLVSGQEDRALTNLFYQQLRGCQYQVSGGPARTMRWGVPDGARDPQTRGPLHDDLIMSAALAAQLDGLDWAPPASSLPAIVRARDPIEDMRGF